MKTQRWMVLTVFLGLALVLGAPTSRVKAASASGQSGQPGGQAWLPLAQLLGKALPAGLQ